MRAKKNISRWKYTDRIIPSVFVEYAVNILQLSVQYQRTMSVWKSVDESGICSKYFATPDKIPMDYVRLEICW
jgi:hypothetical protein